MQMSQLHNHQENITNLASQLLQNECFKLMLRQTVDKMCKKSIANVNSHEEVQSCSQLVSSIVDHLSAYMNESVIKFNTEYSQQLLSRFEEKHKEQEDRLFRRIQQKFQEITNHISEKMSKVSHNSQEKSKRLEILSEKRKTLTTNIINLSVIEEEKENNFPQESQTSISGFQALFDKDFSIQTSRKFQEFITKIHEIEVKVKQNKKQMDKRWEKINKNHQSNNELINNQVQRIRQTVNDLFEANLEGVWNVISELQKRIRRHP